MRLPEFEAPHLSTKAGLVWVGLLALVAAPFPLWFVNPHVPVGFPVMERGVPLFFVLLAGALIVLGRISRASWPFAALLMFAALRGAWHGFPPRTIQLLSVAVFAGMAYAAARDLPDKWAHYAAYGILVGAGWEGFLGTLNAMGVYPWMQWVSPEHVGKPMGFLTHPNYWGSWMALSLPVVWAIAGIPAAALVFLLILKTISAGPTISAAVGILVMAWPLFSTRIRYLVAGLGAASCVGVLTLHEWRLSGRREVWQVAFGEMLKWPLTGQGFGEWRSWADQFNAANYRPDQGQHFFITLQAHSEPIQLVFELGLIGLALGALWAFQGFTAARKVWRAAPAAMLPMPEVNGSPLYLMWGRAPLERAWIAVLAVAAVNMWGSPTFHLPAQAAIALFALARVQADAAALSLPAAVVGRGVSGLLHRNPEATNHVAVAKKRQRKESLNVADCS